MAITNMTDADYSPVLKRWYGKLYDNLYHTYDNLYSQVDKKFDFAGSDGRHPIQVTFGGSVGSSTDGTLPDAVSARYLEQVYTAKRVYARCKIDRKTIKATKNKPENSFVKAVDNEFTGKAKSFNRNMARIFGNDGSGILGAFPDTAVAGSAAAPVVTIASTGDYRFRKAHFESGDYVNIGADDGSAVLSSVFKIESVNRSTGAVTLSRVSGTDDLTGLSTDTYYMYMQNSKDADPYGIYGIFINSTHYGQAEEFRYQPTRLTDRAGAELVTEDLTELVEVHEEDNDETFDVLAMSPIQYRKYIALLEDQKRFPVPVTMGAKGSDKVSSKLLAKVGFSGIEYAGSMGNIKVMKNKFIRDDMVIGLNFKKMCALHMGEFGWFEDDGSVLMRIADTDAYEARYGGYPEILIDPTACGFISGLSVA